MNSLQNLVCCRDIQACVVRLDVCCLDGTVVNHKSISLRTITSEDGGAIEREIKCLCEAEAGVSQEADLPRLTPGCFTGKQEKTYTAGT
jgi:hypothetical protein